MVESKFEVRLEIDWNWIRSGSDFKWIGPKLFYLEDYYANKPLFHQRLGVKFSLKSKHRKSKKFLPVYRYRMTDVIFESGNNYIPGPHF